MAAIGVMHNYITDEKVPIELTDIKTVRRFSSVGSCGMSLWVVFENASKIE